jgi:serine-type D-Ala-D-Ala carboxypeptidase/endopeptidase (penicillin-binding protein 4)
LSGRVLPYSLRTERNEFPVKVLEDLADAVVQKGLKYLDGNVVADDSYFAFERYGEGWTQDDLVWADGAPVSALTINDNVVFVTIEPADRAGERAFVNIAPFADYYKIDNRIITTPAGTGRKIFINREPGSMVLTLWGNMPLGDPGANEALAVEDPASFAGQLFRSMLEKRGVIINGHTTAHHTELASLSTLSVTALASAHDGGGDAPPNSRSKAPLVLASYDSKPLSEDLRVINKVSQNLHAEMLLRLLGHEKGNAGTVESGLEVLKGFLSQAGVPGDEYIFYDGSGLSRQNLVTPNAVVTLLQYAAKQPWGRTYSETFPVAGVDGSLADRFRATPAQGLVLAKTGSLDHVKSLSGYATTTSGDRVAFSIFSNNFDVPGRRAQDAIDRIVQSIVQDTPVRH